MAINKRQRHATLPFLKIDMRHWGPPVKGPIIYTKWKLNIGAIQWGKCCSCHTSLYEIESVFFLIVIFLNMDILFSIQNVCMNFAAFQNIINERSVSQNFDWSLSYETQKIVKTYFEKSST